MSDVRPMITSRQAVRILVVVLSYFVLATWAEGIGYEDPHSTVTTTTTVVMADITYENVPDGECHEDMECWETDK